MNKKKMELYIHIPFCVKKCLYCDFLSAEADLATQKAYVEQLIEEIRVQAKNYIEYQISTIFIGGGTPSILSGVMIANIMSAVYEGFAVEASAEVTIECNPGTLDADKLGYYRHSGINRISLGLQSADDDELRLIGRIHSYEDFLKSFQKVKQAGFDNINVDLISAIPNQNLESWKSTLKKVAMLKPEHISAYSLIIEDGTPFYKMYTGKEGEKQLPDDELDRDMYYVTKDILANYGYQRYEISNYAKAGYECRHNTGYWTGVEYLGLGLGASSYVMGRRFHTEKELDKYMNIKMHEDINPLYQDIQELTLEDRMEEFMFLGLRMVGGVSGSEFMERFGQNMFNIYAQVIEQNVKKQLLIIEYPFLRLTEKGIDLSNSVMSDFIF